MKYLMSHFKQYQKPIDTKKEINQTTELQTRLHTIKNVLDSSLEPKFKKVKYQYTDEEEDTLRKEDKNTMEFRSIISISLLYNLG